MADRTNLGADPHSVADADLPVATTSETTHCEIREFGGCGLPRLDHRSCYGVGIHRPQRVLMRFTELDCQTAAR